MCITDLLMCKDMYCWQKLAVSGSTIRSSWFLAGSSVSKSIGRLFSWSAIIQLQHSPPLSTKPASLSHSLQTRITPVNLKLVTVNLTVIWNVRVLLQSAAQCTAIKVQMLRQKCPLLTHMCMPIICCQLKGIYCFWSWSNFKTMTYNSYTVTVWMTNDVQIKSTAKI